MKLMSIILAGLILSLLGMPCDDIEVIDNNGTENFVSTLDDHNHKGDSTESDGCSPFCICHCCQTNVDIPQHALAASVAIQLNQDKPSFFQGFYPNWIILGIWQPPQSI